jgi:acetyl esterase/lipase
VVTLLDPYAHARSRDNLLRDVEGPTDAVARSLSLELAVRPRQPPLLLVHSQRDGKVDFHNSQLLHEASRRAGQPSTLLLFEDGEHGVGLADDAGMPGMRSWPGRALDWMRGLGALE